MAQRIYGAKITPAAEHDPIVVSVPADDQEQARQLIEAQIGPVKHWWSQAIPKANGQG
jgi:DNA-binding FadR family transcriptional regulator